MIVYKFGGASIETTERAINVADIIADVNDKKLIVVISAKGKTTNALEYITNEWINGNVENAKIQFDLLKKEHFEYASTLLGTKDAQLEQQIEEICTEAEWIFNESISKTYDYYYDQIVCIGELLSTLILSTFLHQKNIKNQWIDIRDIVKTDSEYRNANIDIPLSEQLFQNILLPQLEKNNIIVTQGFIGSNDENHSVTLGREGSDYTAAMLAYFSNAESVSIWKDVPSLLNADPKIFADTIPIEQITYSEVIEMAYYGAQVIHPKTIKPLHNKNIPLYVKSFLNKNLPGTKIFYTKEKIKYPPLMVLKQKQTLLQVTTKDFSFITEENLSNIYKIFHSCKIKINLIQNAAISFVACIDSIDEKINQLLNLLSDKYEVKRNENLFLFTVRHYRQDILHKELKNRTVLLTQKTRHTIQLVVK